MDFLQKIRFVVKIIHVLTNINFFYSFEKKTFCLLVTCFCFFMPCKYIILCVFFPHNLRTKIQHFFQKSLRKSNNCWPPKIFILCTFFSKCYANTLSPLRILCERSVKVFDNSPGKIYLLKIVGKNLCLFIETLLTLIAPFFQNYGAIRFRLVYMFFKENIFFWIF